MPNICESLGFVGEVCDGGFAEEVQLPARLLVRHDPALNPRIAVLAEPLAVAIHAVRRLDARAGEPVLVVGCGTIGGLAALVLSRSHDGPIMVSDLNAGRADAVAQRAKATVGALDAAAISAALQGQRLRYAIDATGSPRAIIDTLGLLSGGGALVLVGISHAKIEIDPNVLVERETALVGCHAFGGELPEAVAMLPELAPLLDGVVDVLPALNDVPQAYDRLLAGGGKALKTVVELAD
jgi:(R,R)-butanediol dehydrogenase/meso-butanediol dehydrogenase/diacetyl reductase